MSHSRLVGRCLHLVLMLAAVPSASGAFPAEDQRLGQEVVPTFESVRLTVDAARPDYSGSAHVDLLVKSPTSSVRFHAQDLTLDRIALASAGGRSFASEPTT